MPDLTLTDYGAITLVIGLVMMLVSNFFRSEKHPGFRFYPKKGERKFFWENRDWFTGPGYYLQSIGIIVLYVGIIWLFVGQFI
ncbi:MAG: hypothetical protein K9N46_09610 [Candidatus Marinimicrobia bacterium]|nr:hypothetical protein [Candidatus Neomarinimicrobiota bacterium]MCF7828425.1 hypothetical protein [Candidatus Neomarinimicrobiota bacterium]MCF7880981.1 hypothetical protein [Candidatus Neomarinimicrobiota bacterium]